MARYNAKYPWDKWLASDTTIKRGEDYNIRTSNMIQVVRLTARRKGIEVSVTSNEDEDEIYITVKP